MSIVFLRIFVFFGGMREDVFGAMGMRCAGGELGQGGRMICYKDGDGVFVTGVNNV